MLIRRYHFSTIDYPSFPAYILFTQGCNFRCFYCHNPELWSTEESDILPTQEVANILRKRVKLIDRCVICGGEPSIHADLPDFLSLLKTIGYKVKLDTNGYNPSLLNLLIKEKLVDFVDMDVKAPLHKYEEIVGVKIDTTYIMSSIEILESSNIPHRFRTVLLPNLTETDLTEIKNLIKKSPHILLPYKPVKSVVE